MKLKLEKEKLDNSSEYTNTKKEAESYFITKTN